MPDAHGPPHGSDQISGVLYDRAERNGVIILIITSSISCLAVVGLLTAIAISTFNARRSPDKVSFVRAHVAFYFISLLVGDLVQAIGSLMSIRWVQDMIVFPDNFCVAQGVIKQLADVSTALWVLAIAIHTFLILFLQIQLKRWVRYVTLISVWALIAGIVVLGPAALQDPIRGPFFGMSGLWCWITPGYGTERMTLDYMIMFISAFCSFILYSLVYLRLRGNLVVIGWRIRFRKRSADWRGRDLGDGQILVIARHMLLYPIAYTILILPIAAARFSEFASGSVPLGVTVFCDTVYLLSGAVNVVLFSTTRSPARSVLRDLFKWHLRTPSAMPESSATTASASTVTVCVDIGEKGEKDDVAAQQADENAVRNEESPEIEPASTTVAIPTATTGPIPTTMPRPTSMSARMAAPAPTPLDFPRGPQSPAPNPDQRSAAKGPPFDIPAARPNRTGDGPEVRMCEGSPAAPCGCSPVRPRGPRLLGSRAGTPRGRPEEPIE